MIVAIDTGGTKTLVTGFKDNGSMLQPIRFETPKDKNLYIKQLVESIRIVSANAEIDYIVVALPGIIENGVALVCPNLGWVNFNLKSELENYFKQIDIVIENDANLAGLAEVNNLSKIPSNALYITISTGIGTGIITDGKINQSLSKSEAGHMILEKDGVFRQWEEFASGRAIKKRYGKYAKDINSKKIWYQITKDISSGLLALIPILEPDVIIIGGSIGTHFDKYSDVLKDYLDEKLPTIIKRPLILQAAHPEQAVLYGCYYNAINIINSKNS